MPKVQCHLDAVQEGGGTNLGFKSSTMRWVYEAIVRPMLSYGATILSNGTRKQHNLQLLGGVQRLANVLITGAMPSTPGVECDNRGYPYQTLARRGGCKGDIKT